MQTESDEISNYLADRKREAVWWLGVHDPALLAQRRQVTKEGTSFAQADAVTEEQEMT